MLKATSIDKIKANVLRPALTSQFLVYVPKPNDATIRRQLDGILGGGGQEKLMLNCCEASLPGSQFATSVNDNDHTGVTERFAYRRVFDDRINLTFYVDAEDYLPIKYFEVWMNMISGEDIGNANIKNNNYNYRFRYPDDYVSDNLTVLKFEKDIITQKRRANPLEDIINIIAGTDFGTTQNIPTGVSIQYQFFRAFPIAVNSMPVSYESSQLLKCTVSMAYTRYSLNNVSLNNLPRARTLNRGLPSIEDGLGSFTNPNSILSQAAEVVAPGGVDLADFLR